MTTETDSPIEVLHERIVALENELRELYVTMLTGADLREWLSKRGFKKDGD